MKEKRRNRAAAVVLAVVFLLAGCMESGEQNGMGNTQAESAGYQKIIDDYAGIELQKDQDSADYGQALDQVGKYLERPDAQSLKTARVSVQNLIREMKQEEAGAAACVPKDELKILLEEYGISYEEYVGNADERSEDLHNYIRVLEVLDEYLSYEETDDFSRKELKYTYEMSVKEHEIMKSYHYISINYWFAGWQKEAVTYVRQKVLGRLASFSAGEEETWENEKKAVEQKLERKLNQLEELDEEWTEHLGKYREYVYQMQQENGR